MYNFEKIKDTLEFNKVLQTIAARCVSPTGSARLLNSQPITEKHALQRQLNEIYEMREILLTEGHFPLWEFDDIRVLMHKLEPGESFLEIDDIQKVRNFLDIITEVIRFNKKTEEKYDHVHTLIEQLYAQDKLLNQINFTIDPAGNIYNNASPELKNIRKEIEQVDKEIHTKLDRAIKKYSEHIRDEYLTLSDGRLVIPVREFSVNKVPGIVHGQSGSGATYFVEPMSVVELNNQLNRLRSDERKEIIKILKRLSRLIKNEEVDLIVNLDVLNELDVIKAKAAYANQYHCIAPQIADTFSWNLQKARHPILLQMQTHETVPLNLHAGVDFNILLLSGPNAGGKTVALKTAGLLQLMFQCGFHIPAEEGTRMPVCKQIFATIGDEQSIEQDLSTFSSHVQSINDVLKHLQDQALVLIDEIGSGTEPSGGAALAIAVLEKLNRKGIVTFASTHQNQIKAYASETTGIENAAMQFDMQHLTPLFSLEIGIPGSSYTLEICRRLGLDEDILKRAQQLAGSDMFKLDQLLSDVVEKSKNYQQLHNELTIKKSELNSLINLYNDRNTIIKKNRKQHEKEAQAKAREIIENANKEVEAAIRQIRESKGDKKTIQNARERLRQQRESLTESVEEKSNRKTVDIGQLQIGQYVRSRQYDIKG
ncbi:MAG: hypothetical protein GF313_08830, partial [Caldithrix sp.]|nr:hypothetical protein [Caldithrix sp.]